MDFIEIIKFLVSYSGFRQWLRREFIEEHIKFSKQNRDDTIIYDKVFIIALWLDWLWQEVEDFLFVWGIRKCILNLFKHLCERFWEKRNYVALAYLRKSSKLYLQKAWPQTFYRVIYKPLQSSVFLQIVNDDLSTWNSRDIKEWHTTG